MRAAADTGSHGEIGILLLSGHLGVAIAPGAELQAAADPAESFLRGGGAFAAAHDAVLDFFETVGFDGAARLFQQDFGNDRLRKRFSGRRRLRALPLHALNITGAERGAKAQAGYNRSFHS